MFETTGVVGEALLKEAWWHMIRPADKWMFALFFPLDAALAGYVIYLELYHFLPWVGLLMFLNVAIMYWNIARSRKVMLGRMNEAYGVPETRVTTRFLE
ncbi:MAG TPA: hypothetical protein VLA21_04100 [Candidatus Limnocylindria bacterium]|nr:hypothetical protein [Candidatus Limnocylindria bacterium]